MLHWAEEEKHAVIYELVCDLSRWLNDNFLNLLQLKDNFLNLLNFLSDFLLTTLLSFGLISSLANISKQHSSINRKLVGSDGVQPGEEVPI